jgi:hypothetical protein
VTVEIEVKRRPRWPGRTALAFGILTVVGVGAAQTAGAFDAFEVATIMASAAISTSVIAVLGGIVAAIGNWERGAAIGGIAFGLLGNPLVLTFGLGATANA